MEGYNVRVGQLGMDLQFGDELEAEGRSEENERARERTMGAPSVLALRAPSWT